MSVLVTGGAGYIGSHTCIELIKAGKDVVVVDNLYNSKLECLKRVKEICGVEIPFYEVDILDETGLDKVFSENKIDSVIHFAGLKAVGESVFKPLEYYHNNVTGTLSLCKVMIKHGVKTIVFSSSATVYGEKNISPLTEEMEIGGATNPYGQTKVMIEHILNDLYVSDNAWNVGILRYFNPIGAHESGKIGEDPNGIPNNLMPYITQISVGKLPKLSIFGDDYDTLDGTGVRDYIHVVDLAKGHVAALNKLAGGSGVNVYNLGTGNGTSVLQLVAAFEKASGKKIPYEIKERRKGDVATCFSSAEKAERELGFKAEFGVERMCADSYRWQMSNPNGL